MIDLPPLGLGCASIGNLYKEVSREEAMATVDAALAAGLTYFDTAPHYGHGLSERRLGDALRELDRDDIVISTKVGRILTPDPGVDTSVIRNGFATPMPLKQHYDYSYDGIMRSVEDSYQRLGLAKIDILFVHDIGELTHGTDNDRHLADLADGGYRALDQLRSSGSIAAIGLGVNEWQVCLDAMEIGQWDCFLLAGRYTLLEQESLETFFPQCEKHGAKIILGGAYNSGILAKGTRGDEPGYYNYEPAPSEIIAKVQKIEAICEAHDVPLAAAALQFPQAHPLIASIIPGLGSARQVERTTRVQNQKIPDQLWADLRAEGIIVPAAPTPDQFS